MKVQTRLLRYCSLLLFLLGIANFGFGQSKKYKVACIGFYNLENLFDTQNDTLINDEEFLPQGSKLWTNDRYREKLKNMSFVISKLGADITEHGVSILGVAEIENRKVLEDLIEQPLLKNRDYKIVHFDSPDFRGIDVAFLYQSKHFIVDTTFVIPLPITKNEKKRTTRDILFVEGKFDDEKMYFLVNHWPSRRGGAAKSAPLRNKGAKICKDLIDSIYQENPMAKVILMGDLNDDPNSPSVKSVLKAKGDKKQLSEKDIFNPMVKMYKKGIGSNAYRDRWSLFDQIMVTSPMMNKKQTGYFFHKAEIFNKKFLIRESGAYKGYPKRTFGGAQYLNGYSDHFPVYIYLIKVLD